MSVPAARIRTSSGWRDIAIQGAQGPPGPMRELAALTFGTVASAAPPGTLVADFGSIAFDGEPVILEVGIGFLDLKANSNSTLILYDFITGTDVQVSRIAYWRGNAVGDAGGLWHPQTISFRWTPSAGNHRFRLRLQLDTGSAINLNQLELPNYARIVKAATGGGLPIGAPLYVTPAQFATLVPTNGMEVYLIADATAGVIWHLRYNSSSSSAYKWEFVGGSPLSHRVETQQALASATYSDLATVGPRIVVPRIGEYRSQFGCRIDRVSADSWGEATLYVGNALPSNYADNAITAAVDIGSAFHHVSRSVPVITLATDTTLGREVKMVYTTPGVNTNFMRRWLELTPIRIS